MGTTIEWDATQEDSLLIAGIAARAIRLQPGEHADKLQLVMDVTACHANGCPLRLSALLDSDTANFVHDISGIRQNICRNTGQLLNCFVPRYAAAEGGEA